MYTEKYTKETHQFKTINMLVIERQYFVEIRLNGVYSDNLCLSLEGKSLGNCQQNRNKIVGKNKCRGKRRK